VTRAPVLLVDDDRDLLQLIAMRLSAAGYAVTAVESGEAALSVSRPQVVVTDLRMHGMDRMALFDAIHRDSPALPVVILTAGASPLPPPESCCSM
jgi:two-component system, NtrC family, response regulator GlrR